MIVEFTGPTGAGKTTISAKVALGLLEQGLDVGWVLTGPLETHHENPLSARLSDRRLHNWRTDLLLLFWTKLALIRRPVFGLSLVRAALGSGGGIGARLNMVRAILRKLGMHAYLSAKSRAGRIWIVDEGLSHAIHNLWVKPDGDVDRVAVRKFSAKMPRPQLIFVLQKDPDQLLERLRTRGEWSPRVPDEAALARFIANACRAYDEFLVFAESDGVVALTDPSVDGGVDGSVEDCTNAILELRSRKASPRQPAA